METIKINVVPFDINSPKSIDQTHSADSDHKSIIAEDQFWDMKRFKEYFISEFQRLDEDGSGALSYDELDKLFVEVCNINDLPNAAKEDIEEILDLHKNDQGKEIDLNEILSNLQQIYE